MLDILVNMTPTGEDFIHTNCHRNISPDCYIVDFAHPGISANIPNKLYLGNRVRRKGTRFLKSLPGHWHQHDIPACSLASILSTTTTAKWTSIDDFSKLAKKQGFFVSIWKIPAIRENNHNWANLARITVPMVRWGWPKPIGKKHNSSCLDELNTSEIE